MAQRNAFAKLRNATGRTIVAAILCHKYSDAPAQTQKFQKIADNTTTNGGLLVSYNTGTFTLGQDWWFVTWMDDLQRVFVTNPQNGRSFFDTVEKNMAGGLALATTYSGIDAVTTGTAVGAAAGPPGAGAGAGAVVTVALAFMTAITSALTNSGTTAGFKSCILRDADAGHFVTISLFPSSVTYSSPSGNDTNNPILQLPNATGKTLLAVPQYA